MCLWMKNFASLLIDCIESGVFRRKRHQSVMEDARRAQENKATAILGSPEACEQGQCDVADCGEERTWVRFAERTMCAR